MIPCWESSDGQIYQGGALPILKKLPDESVNCCVTSPPYWGLRDYGVNGQLGLEKTPGEYAEQMVKVFHEVKRILRSDGTFWLNMGDSYASSDGKSKNKPQTKNYPGSGFSGSGFSGLKPKNLIGIPWMLAFALQADGWYLRQDIIWHKPGQMPESVNDRCTKAHEYIFLLSKSSRYFYDADAIKEKALSDKHRTHRVNQKAVIAPEGCRQNAIFTKAIRKGFVEFRNKRSVWTIPAQPLKQAHFATFPEKLVEPCILAGCPEGGTVLDPFLGSGTTGIVAYRHDRKFIGIDLSETYLNEIAIPRIENERRQRKLF